MESDIKFLVDLQEIDLQVKNLDDQISDGQAALDERKSVIAGKQEKITILQENIAAGEKRKRELEAEVEDELARTKDRQTKLMNVQTNREYQGLLKEIEDGKKANSQREDEIVLILEQNEAVKSKLDELSKSCSEEEALLAEEAGKIDEHRNTVQKKIEKIAASREKAASLVAANLLKKYEMLRSRRNGVALAGVSNGVCKGCNMNIPPQLYNDLLRNEKLLACPTCNRMIFHQAEEKE